MLEPILVRPSVPDVLLSIPDKVNSCPSAPEAVVPPIFRLNVPAVASVIFELIVLDEP